MPTLTLNATVAVATRLAAVGRAEGLGAAATVAQIAAHLRAYCRRLIVNDERNLNAAVFVPAPGDLT